MATLPLTELTCYRGDSAALPFTLLHPDTGAPFDPTGSVLLFTLKHRETDADAAALVQKLSTVGGFTIVAAAAGTITVALVPADYDALTSGRSYVLDVQAQVVSSGAVYTVAKGTLAITGDVTRETTLSIPTTTTNPAAGYGWGQIPDKPAAITALGALTPAADKFPYFTGIAAAALADLTAYARTLLAAANAVALKALLALTKADIGLANADNTSDPNKPVSTAQAAADAAVASAAAADATTKAAAAQAAAIQRANHTGIQSADTITDGTANKVFTATEKTKLGGIATGATANSPDATLLARGNHTGTQLAATISDFASAAVSALATALGLKADLASPALTGTPTAPTAAALTNTTQLATTAFTKAAVDAAGGYNAPTTISSAGDTSLALANAGQRRRGFKITATAGSAAYTATLTLPSTNALAGDLIHGQIIMPASMNPTLQLRNLTSGGTLLGTILPAPVARNWNFCAEFDGTNWFLQWFGLEGGASIDFVNSTRNALATAGALALDGTSGAKALVALTNQNIGTDSFSFNLVMQVPTGSSLGFNGPFVIGPANTTADRNNTLFFDFGSSGNDLRVILTGVDAGGNDGRVATISGWRTAYAGKSIALAFVRSAAATFKIYINAVDTAYAETTGGTPPTWAGSLTSTFLVLGQRGNQPFRGLIYRASLYNLALSAADVLEIYELGGVPERFKFGSQASISSGTLTVGKSYRITATGGTFTGVGAADNNVGTTFTATGTTPTWGTGTLVCAGAICHFDGENELGYQWHDQSTNKLDATLTTTGVTWTKPQRRGYVRTPVGGLSWTATHESKSILGQRAWPNGCVVERSTVKSSASTTGAGITVGDASTANRFVTSTPITTAKKVLTLAEATPAGTSDAQNNPCIDPDSANFTGTIEGQIDFVQTEG